MVTFEKCFIVLVKFRFNFLILQIFFVDDGGACWNNGGARSIFYEKKSSPFSLTQQSETCDLPV